MWLLNTLTRELEYFVSETAQKYAILSHTWGDYEVLFQGMKNGEATKRKGWAKVLRTCQQAHNDGHRYVWIDSCCISRESSSELSEAINSMWLYYCEAEICYALLSDVDEHCPELHPEDDWASGQQQRAFKGARWFERGWSK